MSKKLKMVGWTSMTVNTLKCNHSASLRLKALNRRALLPNGRSPKLQMPGPILVCLQTSILFIFVLNLCVYMRVYVLTECKLGSQNGGGLGWSLGEVL